MAEEKSRAIYGLVGAFRTPDDALGAVRQLHHDGFRNFDVYSPLPIEEMSALLPRRPQVRLALFLFVAALGGAALGYFMQYQIAVVLYPINIGGRPYHSWPAFVPTAWEIAAFVVVYVGFIALLITCRLPKLYHPVFDAPGFERASQDHIFLCVEARDRQFDSRRLSELFAQHRALRIAEVMSR